jgi:NitT/TauT family transport system permease protein
LIETAVAPALPRRHVALATHPLVMRYLYPTLTFVLLLGLWELVINAVNVPDYVIPPPSQIVGEMIKQLPLLWGHTLITTSEVAIGFVLSVLVGVPLAVLIVYSPFFEHTIYPLLVSSQTVPKVAVAPIFLFWFGFGLTPKVLVAFLIAFFPVVIATVVGLRSVEPEMIHLARSMGASPLLTFTKIRLPHALPSLFGGLKVAITLAVVGAVVGEFVGSDKGLGYVVVLANGALNTKLLFAAITFLSLLGVVLFFLVEVVERLMVPPHLTSGREQMGGTA